MNFFPAMNYPYDKLIVISAYIIWTVAIYTVSHKITFKIKKRIEAKHAAAEASTESEEK